MADAGAEEAGAGQAASEEAGPLGGLEQVREILVEPRAQELERAIESLERRRAKEVADLRAEVDRTFDRLNTFIKTENGIASDRLSAERRERGAVQADLHKQMREDFQALEQRIAALEETVANETRGLRQQMLDQAKEFTADVHRWREEMAAAIARDLAGLRAEKADRSVIGRLLSEIGERLTEGARPEVH